MIELIYTSVPQGLLPCTNGYTTAAMTRNVPDRLRQQLEGLSDFSFVETAYGKHEENPVAWNHAILRQGEHVLSRIAAAPSDYTGRTNYLARHFCFPAAEFSSEGGAAMLLKNSDLLSERWDGEVKSLDPDPEKAASFQPPERASLAPQMWKKIFGEDKGEPLAASFATALQALLCTGGRSLYFVTSHTWDPTGKTLLTLFDELIALLPSNLRKKVTFSTYSTGSSISGQFHLRGILKESEEFASIEQQQRPWVDLPEKKVFHEDRLPPCDAKILDAARTGKRADDTPPPKLSATVATPPTEVRAVPLLLSNDTESSSKEASPAAEKAKAVRQEEARRQEAVRREAEEKEASLRQAQAEIRHLEELRLQEELRRHDAERSEATAKAQEADVKRLQQQKASESKKCKEESIEANKTIKTLNRMVIIVVILGVFLGIVLGVFLSIFFRVDSMFGNDTQSSTAVYLARESKLPCDACAEKDKENQRLRTQSEEDRQAKEAAEKAFNKAVREKNTAGSNLQTAEAKITQLENERETAIKAKGKADDALKKLERDAKNEKKKTDDALKKEKEKSEELEKTLEKVNADLVAEKAKNTVLQKAGKDNASTKKSQ